MFIKRQILSPGHNPVTHVWSCEVLLPTLLTDAQTLTEFQDLLSSNASLWRTCSSKTESLSTSSWKGSIRTIESSFLLLAGLPNIGFSDKEHPPDTPSTLTGLVLWGAMGSSNSFPHF